MARVDDIRGLAEFHAESISSSPIDWMNYLDTAARLYRYRLTGMCHIEHNLVEFDMKQATEQTADEF